jgi:hypothetical protein
MAMSATFSAPTEVATIRISQSAPKDLGKEDLPGGGRAKGGRKLISTVNASRRI